MGGMDMVSRDEFEAAKAMAVLAREESAGLKARVEALEAQLAILGRPSGGSSLDEPPPPGD
jgi:BMFP domain-containing protein YqiC